MTNGQKIDTIFLKIVLFHLNTTVQSMKYTLFMCIFFLFLDTPVFGQSADEEIKKIHEAFRNAPMDNFNMTVVDARRKRSVTTEFRVSISFGSQEDVLTTTSSRGDRLTLVVQKDKIKSPARYVRRNGEVEYISTANPAQLLPNIGLQFADILDYLGTRYSTEVKHSHSMVVEGGCLFVEMTSPPYSYYDMRNTLVCGNVIREQIMFKDDIPLKRIEYTSTETDIDWWRPLEIQIFEGEKSLPYLTLTFSYEE